MEGFLNDGRVKIYFEVGTDVIQKGRVFEVKMR